MMVKAEDKWRASSSKSTTTERTIAYNFTDLFITLLDSPFIMLEPIIILVFTTIIILVFTTITTTLAPTMFNPSNRLPLTSFTS